MAKPITSRSSQMLIKLGDGAGPEVFTAPCGLNTKGINFTKEMNDTPVPDCDDPDAPTWVERAVTSMSAAISGEGILSMGDLDTWIDFNESTISRQLRGNTGCGCAQRRARRQVGGQIPDSGFNVTAELGNKVQVAVEMQNDGPVTWTPAP